MLSDARLELIIVEGTLAPRQAAWWADATGRLPGRRDGGRRCGRARAACRAGAAGATSGTGRGGSPSLARHPQRLQALHLAELKLAQAHRLRCDLELLVVAHEVERL